MMLNEKKAKTTDNVLAVIIDKINSFLGPKLRSNLTWIVFDSFIRLGVGFFVGVAISRYLGPEQFGSYSYVLALVTVFSVTSKIGLDNVIVRELAKGCEDSNYVLGSSFLLKIIGGVVSAAGMVACVYFLREKDTQVFNFAVIGSFCLLFQAFDVISFLFQARSDNKSIVIFRLYAFVISTFIKLFLLYYKATVVWFVLIFSFENFLNYLSILYLYKKCSGIVGPWLISKSMCKRFFVDSYPLALSALVGVLYLRLDQFMLESFSGVKELGIYVVAVKIAEIFYILPMAISTIAFPIIVKAQENETIYFEKLRKYYALMAFLGYIVAVPISIASKWLIINVYGNEYIDAAKVLSVLVWGGVFINLGIARTSYLLTANKTKKHFLINCIGFLVAFLMNYSLLPSYGAFGAAISSCVSYWVVSHGSCFLFPSLRHTGIMLTKALFYPKFW